MNQKAVSLNNLWIMYHKWSDDGIAAHVIISNTRPTPSEMIKHLGNDFDPKTDSVEISSPNIIINGV